MIRLLWQNLIQADEQLGGEERHKGKQIPPQKKFFLWYFTIMCKLKSILPVLISPVTNLLSRVPQVFFFNQTYVVETLQHFGILEFSEEEIQVPSPLYQHLCHHGLYICNIYKICVSQISMKYNAQEMSEFPSQ